MARWFSRSSNRGASRMNRSSNRLALPATNRAAAEGFEDVQNIVLGSCLMCHAREPFWEGIRQAPKDVLLETPNDIARQARQIYLQAGVSRAMPPANLTYISDKDRVKIVKWFRAATGNSIAGLL